MPIADVDRCRYYPLCKMHSGSGRSTTLADRNRQIKEDWDSGDWTVEELSSFWELTPASITKIIMGLKGAEPDRAGLPPRQVRRSS